MQEKFFLLECLSYFIDRAKIFSLIGFRGPTKAAGSIVKGI